jgi:hypothetical protein
MRISLLASGELSDESGPAADTGNLAHSAIDHWHKNGQKDGEAIDYMRSRLKTFPKGKIDEAEKYVTPYFADPRNQEAEVVYCEYPVHFTIREAEGDPFGPIYVRGTLDQIRRNKEEGWLELWDVKTGDKYSGWEMLHVYAAQQAAYVLAGSNVLDQPVHPGGIIRPYGYRVRGADLPSPIGVFFHSSWDIAGCHTILAAVRERVRDVRQGKCFPTSGEHCNSCPAGGLSSCIPLVCVSSV